MISTIILKDSIVHTNAYQFINNLDNKVHILAKYVTVKQEC